MSSSAVTESSNDALELLKADGQRVGEYLRASLKDHPQAPARLIEAIEYSLMAGGKRLRPEGIVPGDQEGLIRCLRH